jgi:hypothetical protein
MMLAMRTNKNAPNKIAREYTPGRRTTVARAVALTRDHRLFNSIST